MKLATRWKTRFPTSPERQRRISLTRRWRSGLVVGRRYFLDIEPPHEDHINKWLATVKGRVVHISQSESERSGAGHHVTVCV
jgi:hypothetical protein